MRRAVIITALAISGGFLAMSTAPAAANHTSFDAPNVPVVDPHQHYVVTPNGNVPIGPNACEAGMSLGFDHFHLHVHLGMPGQKNGIVVATGCP